jgi:hypothetical protein
VKGLETGGFFSFRKPLLEWIEHGESRNVATDCSSAPQKWLTILAWRTAGVKGFNYVTWRMGNIAGENNGKGGSTERAV